MPRTQSRSNSSNNVRRSYKVFFILLAIIIFTFLIASFFLPDFFKVNYSSKKMVANAATGASVQEVPTAPVPAPIVIPVTHAPTPSAVKALYMSSWAAGAPSFRAHVANLLETKEFNSIVIDIKDSTGMIAFNTGDSTLDSGGCIEKRIPDVQAYINQLHAKNIYVIGRIAVFEDPCFVKHHPEDAVKKLNGIDNWKDHKGISWLDAGSQAVWDYNIELAKAGNAIGFDEINFDYIRFPSDGDLKNISFPSAAGRTKPVVVKSFFSYLDQHLHYPALAPAFDGSASGTVAVSTDPNPSKTNLVFSADMFGLVTSATDDLGIGQVLVNALPYVDYVSPMVYPSHFDRKAYGLADAWKDPTAVIKDSMSTAVKRANAIGVSPLKLRPWLQDFSIRGVTYTAAMVRDQIQATYDTGLTGWMMWDAAVKYTPAAYLNK